MNRTLSGKAQLALAVSAPLQISPASSMAQ
jgi:hypothetical protein